MKSTRIRGPGGATRATALGGSVASLLVVVGCGLGVVDLVREPSPAELLVVSEIASDPEEALLVRVEVRAKLEPGIGTDGRSRRLLTDILGVQNQIYDALQAGDPPRPTWRAIDSYEEPGPEAVQLVFPRLEGLPPPPNINMRVRVDVTPGDSIVIGEQEDLVLSTTPPTNPAQTLAWSLELTSPSAPAFRLFAGGEELWPTTVRVPAEQMPASAFPLHARLRIQWDRSLNLTQLTPVERYDLALRSIMTVDWRVVAQR
jgi:hypothetical protein